MAHIYLDTVSGRRIDLLHPAPADIDINDIAIGLSNLCRWTGQIRQFYSVAEHSYLVSYMVPDEHRRWGLLHDAEEAYMNDMMSQLKHHPSMDDYQQIALGVRNAILDRFELPHHEPSVVKDADRQLLEVERLLLRGPFPSATTDRIDGGLSVVRALNPRDAKHVFMHRFHELYKPAALRPTGDLTPWTKF